MIERQSNLEALTKLQQKIEEVKELYSNEYIKDEELSLIVADFIEERSPVKRLVHKGRPRKIEGRTTGEAFIEAVNRHLAENPKSLLLLPVIAIEIGVSRERVRQLKVEYEAENKVRLPFLNRKKEVIPPEELDKKVKKLKGLNAKEIAEKLGIAAYAAKQSMVRVNIVERRARNNKIRRLRNKEGWGDKKIAEETGIPRHMVVGILNQLRKNGAVKRIRKEYRSEAEAREFENKLVKMMNLQHLSVREIVATTGEKHGTILGYIGRLRKEGRIVKN